MGISVIGSAGYPVPQTLFRAKRNREHIKRYAERNIFFEKNEKREIRFRFEPAWQSRLVYAIKTVRAGVVSQVLVPLEQTETALQELI